MLAAHRPRVQRPLIVELSSSEQDDEDSPCQHEQEQQDATHEAQHGYPEVPGLHGAGQTPAAVHAALAAQHAVPSPPASVFADVWASPDTCAATAEARRHSAVAAAALGELAARLATLTPADIEFGAQPATSAVARGGPDPPAASAGSPDAERRGLPPGVLIEEVTEEAPSGLQPQRLSAAEVVLLCGTYAQDAALADAWATADTSAAAREVLLCLASTQTMESPGHEEASAQVARQGSSAASKAAVELGDVPAAVQQVIRRVLPAVLRLLRPVLGKPRELRRQGQRAAHMPPMSFAEGELMDVIHHKLLCAASVTCAASDARSCRACRGQSL